MEYDFHRELKATTRQFLHANGWFAVEEVRLPNNRQADIIARNSAGKVLIIEVKTVVRPFHVPEASAKYKPCSHGVYIAGPANDVLDLYDEPGLLDWRSAADDVGLLAIERDNVFIVKPAGAYGLSDDMLRQVNEAAKRRHSDW
jgi:hypothetical protein